MFNSLIKLTIDVEPIVITFNIQEIIKMLFIILGCIHIGRLSGFRSLLAEMKKFNICQEELSQQKLHDIYKAEKWTCYLIILFSLIYVLVSFIYSSL